MSYDPCPECGRPTHQLGESCANCSGRHQDTTEIVDSICRRGEKKSHGNPPVDESDLGRRKEKLRR